MKKAIIILAVFALFSTLSALSSPLLMAADFTLKWDPVANVTGYRVYQSIDQGATWTQTADVPAPTTDYRVLGAPDDQLIFYRVSSYTATAESSPSWRGVWFDARIKPPVPPQGAGLSD